VLAGEPEIMGAVFAFAVIILILHAKNQNIREIKVRALICSIKPPNNLYLNVVITYNLFFLC